MNMKRFLLLVVALVMTTSVGLADGNAYQQDEQYAQMYHVLANNVQIYRDANCSSAVGTLNFGDRVFLQSQFDTVSYVMCGNTFAYVRNSQIGQPMKKVRLTGHVYLSPTRDVLYDDSSTYGCAIGGDRVNEDAFVLCEMSDHYLLLTDEGYMGWVNKYATGIQEIESYRAVNFLDISYYWYNFSYDPDIGCEALYYRVLRPSLNLYRSPSGSSFKKKLSFGMMVEVLDTDGDWCQVVDEAGNTGWIKKAFLGMPVMKLWINGKVRLAPLPGMQDTDFAVAAGGTARNTEAYVVNVIGDYYLVITPKGTCGFVHKDNQNIQVTQTYDIYVDYGVCECNPEDYSDYWDDYYGNG